MSEDPVLVTSVAHTTCTVLMAESFPLKLNYHENIKVCYAYHNLTVVTLAQGAVSCKQTDT